MTGSRLAIVSLLAAASQLTALGVGAATPARPTTAEILFRLEHSCPATGQTSGVCKGYVIDRIIPRLCGGADEPANMQWQTLAQAKEKEKWERIGCRAGRKLVLPQESKVVTEAFSMDAPEPITEVEPLAQ